MARKKANDESKEPKRKIALPSTERVQEELAKAESMDDFFGKGGIFARLFGETMEQMLEAELTEHLGYEPYEAKGRGSGNSRNGHYEKTVRTSGGEAKIRVPRDRKGEYEPKLVKRYASNASELEEKILGLYAKGQSTRDIQDTLSELYGVDISPQMVSAVTDKILPVVQQWQSRLLEPVYPLVYLDAIHLKLRREGRIQNTAVYIVLGVNVEGQRDVLGHWIGDGAEEANFWLSVLSDLQNRGVEDIFIASVDNLSGFDAAIQAVFPKTQIQGCVIHQIRASLRFVAWSDRKEFTSDLKMIYRAATLEEAEANLDRLAERWADQYAVAVRSWHNNWDRLATMFEYPAEIRRMIYTTNSIEGYNRQLRKVTKTKSSFPSADAARKLLYLVNQDITRKWSRSIHNWPLILNQLAIRFDDRIPN